SECSSAVVDSSEMLFTFACSIAFMAGVVMHTVIILFFFFKDTATTEIYTLSLHDALPISLGTPAPTVELPPEDIVIAPDGKEWRSEEHTSELQSRRDLVCRLLLEKKNKIDHKFAGPIAVKQAVRNSNEIIVEHVIKQDMTA